MSSVEAPTDDLVAFRKKYNEIEDINVLEILFTQLTNESQLSGADNILQQKLDMLSFKIDLLKAVNGPRTEAEAIAAIKLVEAKMKRKPTDPEGYVPPADLRRLRMKLNAKRQQLAIQSQAAEARAEVNKSLPMQRTKPAPIKVPVVKVTPLPSTTPEVVWYQPPPVRYTEVIRLKKPQWFSLVSVRNVLVWSSSIFFLSVIVSACTGGLNFIGPLFLATVAAAVTLTVTYYSEVDEFNQKVATLESGGSI